MRKEAVSLLGLTALVLIFPFPFFAIKENRVAEALPHHLFALPPWALAGMCLTVAILALLILVPGLRSRLLLRAGLAALLFPLALSAVQAGSAAVLAQATWDTGRSGPGFGFWMAAVASYSIVYDSLRRSDLSRFTRALIVTGTIAGTAAVIAFGPSNTLGIAQEYLNRQGRFWEEVASHLALSFTSVGAATLIGVPLGIWAFRRKKAEKPVFTVTNGLQTIPSLALFGLLIAPLSFLSRQVPFLRAIGIRGVGNTPAIIALTLYGLLPVVRNTFVGLKSIDRAVVDAGRGMGMNRRELLRIVELPIALPIILTGIRIAAVQTIGNAAVAALIGARGLGNFVFQGLGQAAPDLIVLGVIPIVLLAIIVDRGMELIIRILRPGGAMQTTGRASS